MTALSIPSSPTAAESGLIRRLSRISDRDGLIRTIAIDHPENYLALFDDDLASVSYHEVVESKLEMLRVLCDHASSVLVDPIWSYPQALVTGAVPGDVGVLSGIEDLYYAPTTSSVGFETELRLKPGWDPARLALLGADAAKLVVFHRDDEPAETMARQHEIVADAARACHAVGLPLVVEPLWFPVAGEDLHDPKVRERRRRSVISSAADFHADGADIMKVEFPVLAIDNGLDDLDACHAASADLDAAIDGPWVLLSAGVTFEQFRTQLDVAAEHGCSGFMAGRAIWGDAVGRMSADRRVAGAALAASRLDDLAGLVRGRGAPAWTPTPQADVTQVIPEGWYRQEASA